MPTVTKIVLLHDGRENDSMDSGPIELRTIRFRGGVQTFLVELVTPRYPRTRQHSKRNRSFVTTSLAVYIHVVDGAEQRYSAI